MTPSVKATANRFRFRAWYHHKGNSDNGWMEHLSFGIDETYQNTFLLAKENGFQGMRTFRSLDGFKHELDFALMQSTGLLDRNGKEIFEGDIVRNGSVTEEVRFNDGGYVVDVWTLSKLCSVDGGCEIIGNVHEHPTILSHD